MREVIHFNIPTHTQPRIFPNDVKFFGFFFVFKPLLKGKTRSIISHLKVNQHTPCAGNFLLKIKDHTFKDNAIFLGLVQGLTEFLPISSSAHLRILGELVGKEDPGAAFTAITQIGTETAVVIVFWKDIVRILSHWWKALPFIPAAKRLPSSDPDARMGWMIILGSLPIGILGLLLQDWIDTSFRNLWITVVMLALFGVLLGFVDSKMRQVRTLDRMSWRDAILYGLAQAMAPQSPARPVQPALQQTFQQSANVSQAQSPVIPAAVQQAPAVAGDDGVFGVGTEDDDSQPPSSFLTSNRILLILALLVATVLVFLATWYFSGSDKHKSANESDTQPTTQSDQAAGAAPNNASASPTASTTPSASATPTLKAPAPANAQELSAFDAPSGNISCTLKDNNLTCVINEHASTTSCPSSKPLTVTIGTDGKSSQSCGSTFTPKGVSLSYGSAAKNSTFACESADSGMQCWSQVTGQGFILSRESVTPTTHRSN